MSDIAHTRLCIARVILLLTPIGTMGCHRDMRDQPRYEALESSDFFGDGQSARPLIPGTVARGSLQGGTAFQTGVAGKTLVAQIPLPIDRPLLERGRERFEIYCTPCHSRTGNGDGMIVQRGFERPPSYHIQRLRDAPAGHFFDVITNGIEEMPRYGPQIPPADRWAIVAYIRVLQLSQHADLDDVPRAARGQLDKEQP